MKNIVLTLTIVIFCASCSNPNEAVNAVFERGFKHDSIYDYLDYYTIRKVATNGISQYEYLLDSSYAVNDSGIHISRINRTKSYKIIYTQSFAKDSLLKEYYLGSSKEDEIYLSLIDTLTITECCSKIYKYEILNPDIDGDLTLFFNDEIGLIERYNNGWGGRKTLNEHTSLSKKEVSNLLEILKSNFLFYNSRPPVPNFEDMKIINLDSIIDSIEDNDIEPVIDLY